MLWDSLIKFFIQHVFGGSYFENGSARTFRGLIFTYYDSNAGVVYNDTAVTKINFLNTSIPLGNYLSFLASLISITFIVVLCCLFVYKIIKLVGGLITR